MPRETFDTGIGLEQAYYLLAETLDVLDACKAPPSIAPHVEMAIAETRRALAGKPYGPLAEGD